MIRLQFFSTDTFYRLVSGLLLSLVLIFFISGSVYYLKTSRREKLYRNASHEYAMLISEFTEKTSQFDLKKAERFTIDYLNTPYYALMQFHIAHHAIQRNDLEAAFKALSAIMDNTKDPNIEAIARQRAARVLMTMKQFEKALTLIEHKSCEGYSAACQIIKGDIFLALGEKQKALQAYQAAKQISPDIETLQPLLQIKLDDLGNLSEALPL
jgi:predicted negative regulator of RcsB-dependent stress response